MIKLSCDPEEYKQRELLPESRNVLKTGSFCGFSTSESFSRLFRYSGGLFREDYQAAAQTAFSGL